MASVAAKKLIDAGTLHEHLQGDDGTYFMLLKLIDSQSASDSYTNVFDEIFLNRLALYSLQPTVRKLRTWAAQFEHKFGPMPKLDV